MKNRAELLWIFVLLVLPQTALAAWGENWGDMVWGVPVSVPTLPGMGLIVLALAATAARVPAQTCAPKMPRPIQNPGLRPSHGLAPP
jgi:hypothetical protein